MVEEALLNTLDTLAFPVYYGSTYKSIVWPESNQNDYVPISFIRFAKDTTDCMPLYFSMKEAVLNEAKEYTRRGIEDYFSSYRIRSLNWHTVEEMNAKYK